MIHVNRSHSRSSYPMTPNRRSADVRPPTYAKLPWNGGHPKLTKAVKLAVLYSPIVQRMMTVQANFFTATEFQIAAGLFIVVFALNVLPAFAPPTWTTMSFVGFAIPNNNFVLLSFVAAIAATSGRVVLAKLSRALVRRRLLSEKARRNVDAISLGIERRPALTFGTFLGYALSPLPSNYLFIAYGLTSLPIASCRYPSLSDD